MKTLFTKPIVIQLLPSSLLLGLLLVVATISSMILLTAPIIMLIKLSGFALIVASSAYFIARDALLLLPWSWKKIEINTKGVLTLVNNRQQRINPLLSTATFVHEYCVILNLKRQSFNFTLPPVLLFKNTDKQDELRRLRIWLRMVKNKTNEQAHLPTYQALAADD